MSQELAATAHDAPSAPFFAGLAEGRLMIQRCAACGIAQLGQDRCLSCRHERLEWAPSFGEGAVYAYTVIHTVFHPAFADEVPYVAAVVELDEGPRINARIRVSPPDHVQIGLRVRAEIVEYAPGAFAPVFSPVDQHAGP